MAGAIYKGVQMIKCADGSWEICKSEKPLCFPDRFASLEDAQGAIDAVLANIGVDMPKDLLPSTQTPVTSENEEVAQIIFNLFLLSMALGLFFLSFVL